MYDNAKNGNVTSLLQNCVNQNFLPQICCRGGYEACGRCCARQQQISVSHFFGQKIGVVARSHQKK